jgi:hypothetical protein
LPWYTYPAIEYISQLELRDRVVFEYGLGNSSLFWAGLAGKVFSLDHNREWYDRVSTRAPENVKVLLATDRDEYIRAIHRFEFDFDVIVVDGIERYQCCKNALEKLKEGGLIILDNSDWYPRCTALLRSADLIQVDMTGFGPICGYTWVTSFFLHRKASFKTRFDRQPIQVLRPNAASNKAGLTRLLEWEQGLRSKPLVRR